MGAESAGKNASLVVGYRRTARLRAETLWIRTA
jgi:hypothetical protein